jgi:hypothetical protein
VVKCRFGTTGLKITATDTTGASVSCTFNINEIKADGKE